MSWHRQAGGQLPQVSTDVPWQGQPERSGWDAAGDTAGWAALEKPCRKRKRLGTVTQLPAGTKPCPVATITLFSRLLRSGVAQKSARKAAPARAHIPSPSSPRPSAQPCMWVCCSLLARSERSYSLQCPRGEPQWGVGGCLLTEDGSRLTPWLLSQSRVACTGSGAEGSVFEASKLCAAGCPDQYSFPPEALALCLPLRGKNSALRGVVAFSVRVSGLVGHSACPGVLGCKTWNMPSLLSEAHRDTMRS